MSTFGNATGTTTGTIGLDSKRVTRFVTGKAGDISKITVKLSGAGSGTGSQVVKALVYSDNAGNPDALLGTSTEVTVTDGQAAAEVDFTFAATVAVTAATYYHLGFIAGANTNTILAYYAAGGDSYGNADTYSDGAANPFGAPTASASLYWIYATYNVAPNAPALTAPVSSAVINLGITNRFTWTFSDDDPGDLQSLYDIQVRPQGSAINTVDTFGVTANAYHDVAGATLSSDDYEWRVRTYDTVGLVGVWTTWEPFKARSPEGVPTITAPAAAATITTPTYAIVWSQANQASYQVRTVADAAGSPNTAIVYQDTGTVVSTSARTRTMAFATSGRDEHVQVRTFYDGLWSDWDTHKVTVNYTAPAVPIVDLTVGASFITVNVGNPPPLNPQPTVTSWDIYRAVTGSESAAIRVAAGVSADWTDYAIASGVDYSYRAKAIATTGATTYSAWESAEGVYLRLWSNLANGGTFDPSIALSAGYPTPAWTVTHPDGTVQTSNSLTPSFTISGTGITRCELTPTSLYPYVTTLDANTDGLVGTFTARDLGLLPNLQRVAMYSNPGLVASFALADLPVALTYVEFGNNTASVITGSLADLKSAMTELWLYSTASVITGSLADLKAAMTVLHLRLTASVITGGATQMAATSMTTINLENCASISQAGADSIALRCYTDRALFTGATLGVKTSGTTGDLSGVYQNATPPTTGLERVYKLVVDPDNDHTKVFTWSY